MSLFDGDEATVIVPAKCSCCAATASGAAWGVNLCPECFGVWRGDKRFEAGEVEKAIGMTWPTTDADLQRSDAEYEKRTKAWVLERRVLKRQHLTAVEAIGRGVP